MIIVDHHINFKIKPLILIMLLNNYILKYERREMTKIYLKLHIDNKIQAQYKNFWLIKVWTQRWDVKFIVISSIEELSYVKQQHKIIPGTTPSHVPPRWKPWLTQLWKHCALLTQFPFWHFVPGRSKSCANPVFTTNI